MYSQVYFNKLPRLIGPKLPLLLVWESVVSPFPWNKKKEVMLNHKSENKCPKCNYRNEPNDRLDEHCARCGCTYCASCKLFPYHKGRDCSSMGHLYGPRDLVVKIMECLSPKTRLLFSSCNSGVRNIFADYYGSKCRIGLREVGWQKAIDSGFFEKCSILLR